MKVGVCSWSLCPEGPEDLVEKVLETGIRAVQLALDPLRHPWGVAETLGALDGAGIEVLSGMMMMEGEDYSTFESIRVTGGVRPRQTWEGNLRAAHANAQIARDAGIDLITFHAGFIPHSPQDPERALMLDRLKVLSSVFAEQDCRVALETGQESAATLVKVMAELDSDQVGINFDPANMILYGMGDPITSLELLAPHIFQLHIKDALASAVEGEWGSEQPAGDGAVDWSAFFTVLEEHSLGADLVIEREAGDQRVADVIQARQLIDTHLGGRSR
ncbi:MAG: sugar phosphate isomerase/epimerase [Planctomycetota bacterium]|nr:sugar phosphate isomerase/epimerase [Planctomycetota bacterium]